MVLQRKKEHEQEIKDIELSLETQPRDSKFSSQLIVLMQKEENMLRNDTLSPASTAAANELLVKINEMLNAETRKFFRKNVQANIKKWTNQENKLTKERARLHQDIINDARIGRLDASSTNDVVKPPISLSDAIKREEARLIEDYNRNWFEYEGFNLKEAFKSQTAKVNADWETHETSITDEYNNKRKLLTKDENQVLSNVASKTSSPDGFDSRWQHPEKQKTLIHTAPVLSPSKKEQVSVSNKVKKTGSKTSNDIANQIELERIERVYSETMQSLAKQKQTAVLWMDRQSIRLHAQLNEVKDERSFLSNLLHNHNNDYDNLIKFLSK